MVEGQWLWIEDHGGYRSPPASGWASSNDVLKVDDPNPLKPHNAYAYYSGELKRRDDPWLHWMLGIYLEKKGETKGAKAEYMLAKKDPGLLDAEVRARHMEAVLAKSASAAVSAAQSLQGIAERAPGRPRVRVIEAEAWKAAYEKVYQTSGCEKQAEEFLANAEKAYERATQIDRNWALGYLGRAELRLYEHAQPIHQGAMRGGAQR